MRKFKELPDLIVEISRKNCSYLSCVWISANNVRTVIKTLYSNVLTYGIQLLISVIMVDVEFSIHRSSNSFIH